MRNTLLMMFMLCGFMLTAQQSFAATPVSGLTVSNVSVGTVEPQVYDTTMSVVINKTVYAPGETVFATFYAKNDSASPMVFSNKSSGYQILTYLYLRNGNSYRMLGQIPAGNQEIGPGQNYPIYSLKIPLTANNVPLAAGTYSLLTTQFNFSEKNSDLTHIASGGDLVGFFIVK